MAEKNPNRPDNVIRINRRLPVTFVSVVFFLILVYFAVQGIRALNKTSVSAYNVGAPASDNVAGSYTAVILREEDIISSGTGGTVNYFAAEESRMNSGALICTIDKKGDLKDRLSRAESSITLSKERREQIRMAVKDAISQFDPEHFKTSSDGATMVRSALFTSYVNDGKELVTEMISDADATALYAAESGFLLFYEDGYESKTPESLTLSDFDPALSSRVERKSAETVEEGTFLYKIIPDNRFRLCILLGEEAADRFSKRKELSVRIGKDTVLRAPFSLVTGVDGSAIGVLDFAKYGGNFLKDRFLEVEILDESVYGYKIPESAIVQKSFFVVGQEFVTSGGGTNRKGLLVKEGENTFFEPATVYEKSSTDENTFILGEDYAYVYADTLSAGMTIIGNSETGAAPGAYQPEMALGVMTSVEGVYQINNGYCVFKPIIRLSSSIETSYVMAAADTRYGISPYDRIVLNAKDVSENEIIYE